MCRLNDPLKVEIDGQDREALAFALGWIEQALKDTKGKVSTLRTASQGLRRLQRKIHKAEEWKDKELKKWFEDSKQSLEDMEENSYGT